MQTNVNYVSYRKVTEPVHVNKDSSQRPGEVARTVQEMYTANADQTAGVTNSDCA